MIRLPSFSGLPRSWWRKELYPSPAPLPRSRSFWFAMGLVVLAALSFSLYLILYLTRQQDAYLTHAEDLGIMDQAMWTTLHGQVLHQTICNIIGDSNCVSPAGISRLAIHFEPILFVVSLFYLVVASPKTLMVLQTLIVASGALPAFWLARQRLRSDWAALAPALLYLLFPAQLQATVFDFHAVTFTIALLMFLLYFLYTRQTTWLFVFALLSLACKEEIAGIIAFIGLWAMLLQHRWRVGLALVALALAWTGGAILALHFASPTGHPLLISRYSYLGTTPLAIARTLSHPAGLIKQHLLEPDHLHYLRQLLSPTAYLALLAPWVLVLGTPTLLLNLLSTDPQMYSGLFQYSAELVPIFVFATIEAAVLMLWLTRRLAARVNAVTASFQSDTGTSSFVTRPTILLVGQRMLLALVLAGIVFMTLRADRGYSNLPFAQGFRLPSTSAHVALAQSFLQKIPARASVSAQSSLVPHLSHRSNIYLFPYADTQADYVFLDVTSDMYPFYSATDFIRESKRVLLSGRYGVVDAHDGYLLLKKGLPAPGVSTFSAVQPTPSTDPRLVVPNIPRRFCSFVRVPNQQAIPHPVQVSFQEADNGPESLQLIGFSVNAPARFSIQAGYLSVTTYWRVLAPVDEPLQLAFLITNANGGETVVSTDVPSLVWCQSQTWKSGMMLRLTSQVFSLKGQAVHPGKAFVSLALLPLLQGEQNPQQVALRRPLSVGQAPTSVRVNQASRTVQLTPITLLP